MAEQVQNTATVTEPQVTPAANPFASTGWVEALPNVETAPEVKLTELTKPIVEATPIVEEEEVLEPKDWLKREFEVDDIEVIKKEREELKQLRLRPQTEEKKFANEQSRLAYEALAAGEEDKVYELLNKKRKLSTADKLAAADLLKLNIAQSNEHYSDQDVIDVYEEKYSLPRKPIQAATELDEEYTQRVSEWQTEVDKINRRIERDAFVAKEQIEKMKFELKFEEKKQEIDPQIAEAKQKELDSIAALRTQYMTRLESDYKNFNGFEVRYKGEEGEIPVSFLPTEDEKVALRGELENFDVDGFIMDRWFDEKGEPKITQMMEDVTLLRKKEAILQKVANEIGTKMREHYIKLKGQVNVTGNNQFTFQPTQTGNQSVNPFKADSWKEIPASS